MANWLKIFLPRKYAVIDGRRVTEPIINGSDTTFTVTGDSNWGSTSKYNVHLQGPNSYYLYKTLSELKDDPSAGGTRQEQITVTGNEPERLNRYRGYLNLLTPEDYKYWWQQIVSKACGGKVEKGEDGMKSNHYIYDKPLRKYEYNEPDYMNHYTPETDIDRTGTRPRYDAVIGRIHRTTAFKVPEVKPNFAGLMAPGEVRQYIDPKTYRIQTIAGPVDPHYRSAIYEYGDDHDESIRNRMKNNNGIFYLGNDDREEAGYDVITWPDGSRRVVLTSAPKIYIPKGDYQIPSNPNDNTLTSGSIEKGNIKGGLYPGIQEPIQAPEGYNPADEWEETHDQVNGGVRKTWRNRKTGDITRVNPNKKESGGKLYNEDLITAIEACGGKIKKACGGKMKKKK